MVIEGAREALRRWRDRRRLLRSGLFDAGWYRSAHPDAAMADPARHFLKLGARAGLKPHPLFDTAWYNEQYPDVIAGGANPVLHYLISGAAEGRDPNPYFSSAWYLSAYPEIAAAGANPLAHYIRHGGPEGRRPSARFDPAFYLQQLADDAPGRDAPLTHFLTQGEAEGLQPTPYSTDLSGEPVEWAQIEARRPWTGQGVDEVALLVAHAPDGRLKAHVAPYVRALEAAGVEVILIVAGDAPFRDDDGAGSIAGLYLRENAGFDFAAWAHLLKLLPRLWDAPRLYLLNDSVVGPVTQAALQETLRRVRADPAEVVGLTESRERGWHVQSYFLALKRSALANARVQGFFNRVRNLEDKQAVIDRYEVSFASEMVEGGLKVATLYRRGAETNATLFAWRDLLAEGFPFVKAAMLTGRHDDVDARGWRGVLAEAGYDVALAEALLQPLTPVEAVRTTAPRLPWRPDRIAFYGPWNYANGLGEASRGYLSALWRLGALLNLHALKTPFHIHRRVSAGYDVCDFVDAADVAIVHLNPDGLHLLTAEQRTEINRARLRIGLWVWEMSHVPDFFRANFDAVDVIWTPSRYCADVFAAATDRPVHVVPHVVPVPPAPTAPAALHRTILYAFDGSSYLARKNPMALVEAFALSGLAARGWTLVLKTKNLSDNAVEAKALTAQCAAASGVSLIDRPVSREDMAQLFARADIYASPHASEGFGLTIAEAMAAGKLVVATDYGGSCDFLDATCGYLVACDVVTLTTDYGHYRKGGQWAHVRVDALAQALADAAVRLERGDHSLGEAARARIAERLSADAVAAAMRASFTQLAPLVARIERERA